MGTMAQWDTLRQRITGKWQFPLLIVSLGLLAAAIYRPKPPPNRLPIPEAAEYLALLVAGQEYRQAIELGELLVSRDDAKASELAPVWLSIARAHSGVARGHRGDRTDLGRGIVGEYEKAATYREALTADDQVRIGEALEWQSRFSQAVEAYGRAVESGVNQPLDLRRRAITLTLDHLDPPAEAAGGLLDGFLAEVGDDRLDLRLWAVERLFGLLTDQHRLDEAAAVLSGNHDRFEGSDLRFHFGFLEALLLYEQDRFDEAETRLRAIRDGVPGHDPVDAMAGWLLGRVVMSDAGPQRPEEALSFFSDVLAYHVGDPYAVASRVGAGEALALLERHDEALEAYLGAIEDLKALGETRVVNRALLRTSLSVLAEKQRQSDHVEEAAAYAQLAVTLLDREAIEPSAVLLQQLAQLQALLASRLDRKAGDLAVDPHRPPEARSEAARAALVASADTYLELARLDALNERRAAEANWWAAELYAKAGRRDRAATLYRAFVADRPRHPFVPRALLRIGQLLQLSGRPREAVEAYQDCYRRFPQTLDGARALVPLAEAYLAMGPQFDEAAERTLRIVLDESEVFTPQAPEFADALFLLGEALNRRGEFERGIATFEEVLGRYPDDPRVWRARYLLADSYRRSGLALKAEAKDATYAEEMKRMRDESAARFDSAKKLYRELIEAYDLRDPASLDRRERVYLRHAHLYEADCYFETQDYARALKLYEESAGLFKELPSALAANVQMINCHVFLGQPEEARAALARAKVLVDSMPDSAFAQGVSPERREDWKRYFEWLGTSELF